MDVEEYVKRLPFRVLHLARECLRRRCPRTTGSGEPLRSNTMKPGARCRDARPPSPARARLALPLSEIHEAVLLDEQVTPKRSIARPPKPMTRPATVITPKRSCARCPRSGCWTRWALMPRQPAATRPVAPIDEETARGGTIDGEEIGTPAVANAPYSDSRRGRAWRAATSYRPMGVPCWAKFAVRLPPREPRQCALRRSAGRRKPGATVSGTSAIAGAAVPVAAVRRGLTWTLLFTVTFTPLAGGLDGGGGATG